MTASFVARRLAGSVPGSILAQATLRTVAAIAPRRAVLRRHLVLVPHPAPIETGHLLAVLRGPGWWRAQGLPAATWTEFVSGIPDAVSAAHFAQNPNPPEQLAVVVNFGMFRDVAVPHAHVLRERPRWLPAYDSEHVEPVDGALLASVASEMKSSRLEGARVGWTLDTRTGTLSTATVLRRTQET